MRVAGVTLMELMLTLAIVCVVATLGTPSFLGMLARHAVAAEAQDLQDAVRLGRNEAMKRGGPVILCRADALDSGRCADGHGSWQAWLLFADPDRNGAFNEGDTLVRRHQAPPHRLTIAASATRIRFESTGIVLSDDGAAIDFVLTPVGRPRTSGDGDRESQRRVCVNPRGQVVVIGGAATCP